MTPLVPALLALHVAAAPPSDAINAVLGDASWIAAHGTAPGSEVPSEARIATHLAYVEARLRASDRPGLSEAQRRARARLLDALAAYRARGEFPRRGEDGYAGRRPRFIDDRGVHCAVGHLIAESGDPALAAAINARYEYAYVEEIAMPELLAWATAHGFTAAELAMIQPSYEAPPTEASTRRALGASADAITLRCAREHRPPATVVVHVAGLRDGRAEVTTRSMDPFSVCFAEAASGVERGGGAYDGPISTYSFDARIRIRDPQQILEARVGVLEITSHGARCWPRPGPVVRDVRFEVTVGGEGARAKVSTRPVNDEVAACLSTYIQEALRDFGAGTWRLRAQGHRAVTPYFEAGWFAQALEQMVRSDAPECSEAQAAFPLEVGAVAKKDADGIEFSFRGGDEAFARCLEPKLQARVRSDLGVSRQRQDGTWARYFRIDAEVRVKVRVEVETRAERARREKAMRDELERQIDGMH